MAIPIPEYLAALGLGIGTGFVSQRGRVCTNSAFRNLLLIRNGELGTVMSVAVAVETAGYLLLTLIPNYSFSANPIPLSFIFLPIGALVFGLGTVFAGGCAGGLCYRVGEGNTKSLLALMGFAAGIEVLSIGPIAEVFQSLNHGSLILIDKQVPSLDRFAPRIIWTVVIVLGAAVLSYLFHVKAPKHKLIHLRSRWTPPVSGALIGVFDTLAKYFSSLPPVHRNFGLSTIDGIGNIGEAIVAFHKVGWAGFLVLGLVAWAFLSSLNIGEFDLILPGRKDVIQFLSSGFILGLGGMMAGGCNIGHIFGGIPELGISSFLALTFMLLGNWAGSYLYYIRWRNEWPESTPRLA